MNYSLVDIHFHTNDSFDAYENASGINFSVADFITEENKSKEKIKLIVKTDHNVLNYQNYLTLKESFGGNGILLLPGIEINGDNKVHWIFIFDDKKLEKKQIGAIKTYGELLDDMIISFLGYNGSFSKSESKEIQNHSQDIYNFICKLNDLEIEYIVVPHLDKTNGMYELLKRDEEYFLEINKMLLDNVINGFESKHHNDFFKMKIEQTLENINIAEKVVTPDPSGNPSEQLARRYKHLEKMKMLDGNVTSADVSIIYGSDFHGVNENYEDYQKCKNQLFYMKSELSFEGLKYALLDSDSRIFSAVRYAKHKRRMNIY